jgi:hypothetical protein
VLVEQVQDYLLLLVVMVIHVVLIDIMQVVAVEA